MFSSGSKSISEEIGKLPRQDLNLDKVIQSHLCYRYTTRQNEGTVKVGFRWILSTKFCANLRSGHVPSRHIFTYYDASPNHAIRYSKAFRIAFAWSDENGLLRRSLLAKVC